MAVNRLCMVAQMGQSWKVGKKQFPWQPVLDSCRWWPSPISLPSFSLFLDMFAFFQSPHHQRKHNAVSAAYRGDRPVQPSRGWTPSAPGAALAEPYKMNPCRTPWKCCLGAMSTHGRCGPRLILSSLIGSGSVMDHILIGLHVVTRGTLTAARQQHQRLRKHTVYWWCWLGRPSPPQHLNPVKHCGTSWWVWLLPGQPLGLQKLTDALSQGWEINPICTLIRTTYWCCSVFLQPHTETTNTTETSCLEESEKRFFVHVQARACLFGAALKRKLFLHKT